MANWTKVELAEFERRVATKLEFLDERIEEYRELTKPIPPENAIGRVSRMDAINNKSVKSDDICLFDKIPKSVLIQN